MEVCEEWDQLGVQLRGQSFTALYIRAICLDVGDLFHDSGGRTSMPVDSRGGWQGCPE